MNKSKLDSALDTSVIYLYKNTEPDFYEFVIGSIKLKFDKTLNEDKLVINKPFANPQDDDNIEIDSLTKNDYTKVALAEVIKFMNLNNQTFIDYLSNNEIILSSINISSDIYE